MRGKERLKMGCIMTPMPNYLSTCLSLPLNHIRVVGMKGNEQCGDEERWAVWMRWCVDKG